MELAFQPFERLPGGLPSEIWHYILDIVGPPDSTGLNDNFRLTLQFSWIVPITLLSKLSCSAALVCTKWPPQYSSRLSI